MAHSCWKPLVTQHAGLESTQLVHSHVRPVAQAVAVTHLHRMVETAGQQVVVVLVLVLVGVVVLAQYGPPAWLVESRTVAGSPSMVSCRKCSSKASPCLFLWLVRTLVAGATDLV